MAEVVFSSPGERGDAGDGGIFCVAGMALCAGTFAVLVRLLPWCVPRVGDFVPLVRFTGAFAVLLHLLRWYICCAGTLSFAGVFAVLFVLFAVLMILFWC